jgi:hypothetical protein
LIKSLQHDRWAFDQGQIRRGAKVYDRRRYQDLVRVGDRAEPRSKLNGRAEQIAVMFHGLSGSGADAHPQPHVAALEGVRRQVDLDSCRTRHCGVGGFSAFGAWHRQKTLPRSALNQYFTYSTPYFA